ncbi:MAG TPA: flagellar export chaperone FlgN [Gammaproteobacteria bacterium]|nr:flagellar export chaperone FlgN [Gammaproteobacteria bacterium]
MTAPKRPQPDAQDHAALLAARLDALLEEAGTLVDQLEAVGEQQHHAIESGQVHQIVEIVETRDPLVRSLVRVGEELNAFIEDGDARACLDDDVMERALRRIAIYEHTMKRLRERDAKDQQLMEQARDKIASQLASMGSGKNALRAYSSRSTTPNPIMQDRRG